MNILHATGSGEFNEMQWGYHEWLLLTEPGATLNLGLMPGWANPTGLALITIFTIMVLFSFPCVRRGGHFEVSSISIDICYLMSFNHLGGICRN